MSIPVLALVICLAAALAAIGVAAGLGGLLWLSEHRPRFAVATAIAIGFMLLYLIVLYTLTQPI